MSKARQKKASNDDLGPVGTVIFFGLLIVGPIYAFLGPLFWILLGVAIVSGILAGINWLFNRDRW